MALGQALGTGARPGRADGAGWAGVSGTTRVASSPFALAPAGRKAPRKGLLFFGSATKLRFFATSEAVRRVPSEQVMPSASVSVTELPWACQLLANADWTLPVLPSTLTNGS